MSDVKIDSEAQMTDLSVEKVGPSESQGKMDLQYSTFGHELPPHGGRDRWPSRLAFYMAAMGSAVGFGNGKG